MPEPRTIQEPVQVVVEGKAMEYFFDALSSNMGVTEIQIQNFGGTSELSSFLKALRRTPGFEKQVTSLGIIRDAEDNPSSAFRSVQHALRSAKFTVPAHPEIPEGISPRVTILILPNATQPGMLETLCLQSVTRDPAMRCVDEYFECIEIANGSLPNNMDKAKVQAFLASRDRPGLLVGQAAAAGYWPWTSDAFSHVRRFIQNLEP